MSSLNRIGRLKIMTIIHFNQDVINHMLQHRNCSAHEHHRFIIIVNGIRITLLE